MTIVVGSADRLFGLAEQRRLARAYGDEPVVITGGAHDLMLGPHWEAAAIAVETAASST